MRITPLLAIAALLPAVGVPNAGAQAVPASCYGPIIQPGVECPGEQVDPASAINTPSAYSWTVFAELNQPAFPANGSDTRRVWETWKSADDNRVAAEAIYLDDGHAPQPWNVRPQAAPPEKRLVPIQQLQLLRTQAAEAGRFDLLFLPPDPLSEEVRTNRPGFDFILRNELYNRQGQYRYASAHPGFDFPITTKEVKAVWIASGPGIDPADYYSASVSGETYVLVAMHVITKDLPFWHWASFVHKDQNRGPKSGYVAPLADDQNVPASLQGTPFVNYRLLAELVRVSGRLVSNGRGAQVGWVTRTGEPTVIGNPHIEQGFETKSSCITCHARASIGLTSTGAVEYNSFTLDVGAVDPAAFERSGVVYHPLDFLWSLRQAKNFRP